MSLPLGDQSGYEVKLPVDSTHEILVAIMD